MMPDNSDVTHQKVSEWLEKAETQNFLRKLAASVRKNITSQKTYFPFKIYGSDHVSDQDILSDLNLFILEKISADKLVDFENKNLGAYLRTAYLNHLKDKARRFHNDPTRHLYKRTTDIIRNSKKFFTTSSGKKTSFSLKSQNHSIPPLMQEDYKDIPFPFKAVKNTDYQSINTKKNLCILSEYFWKAVSARWQNKAVWVEVRDFIRWLQLYINTKQAHEHPLPVDREIEDSRENEYIDIPLVKHWAYQFSNQLTEIEKKAFYLHFGLGMLLKDVAKKLNYKSASGPVHPIGSAKEKLKMFLRDLPWLSPEDFNQEAMSIFIETLIFNLKKSESTP